MAYYGKAYNKKFGKKTYHLLGGFNTKSAANSAAGKARRAGRLARVVKVADGYNVYYTGAWMSRVVG